MTEVNYENLLYNRAVSTMKAHGIVAIILGSLGSLFGLIFAFSAMFFGSMASYGTADMVEAVIYGIATIVFWVIPHIFFIISGAYLVRHPSPKLAKGLIITNLIISAFWNIPILVLSIINLTQITDYSQGYKKS